MHWLADQVAILNKLSERPDSNDESDLRHDAIERAIFMEEVRKVVSQISQRSGVLGCFVAHEGFLVESAGESMDYEALAAMSQWCGTPAEHAAATLSLGGVQQILIVGSTQKLALIQLGQMLLGIISPTSVLLSETLRI